jgi:hypothetical protein
MSDLTPEERYQLKKLYEVNPDLYKRSEVDKKKYGEEKLKRTNQELLYQLQREAEERYKNQRITEQEVKEYIEKEGEAILKGRKSWLVEKKDA